MKEQFQHLEATNLFHIARNDNALPKARLAAAELLVEREDPMADDPEIAVLVAQVKQPKVVEEVAELEPEPEPEIQNLSLSVGDSPFSGQDQESPAL